MIDTKKRMNIKDFRTLNVYKKSVEFENEIYNLLKGFPRNEEYGIINQMARASTSISQNIVQGVSQEYRLETIKSCSIAMGSANEMRHWILVSMNQNYINEESFCYLEDLLEQIIRMLIGYINMIRTSGESEVALASEKIHIKDFRTLKVYQKSLELTDLVYNLTRKLTIQERNIIGNKMINTANSVGANIAEGGQLYKGRTITHCNIALSKAGAMMHLIDLADRQGYADSKEIEYLSGLLSEISKMLIGYINMVKRELE